MQQPPQQYGATGQPSHAAPGQVPGRVEVKVSYGARLGCSIAAAAVLLILSIVAFANWYLSGTGKPDAANAPSAEKCWNGMTGPKICSDSTTAGSKDYDWTATEAGAYTFTLKSPGVTRFGRSMRVLDDKFTTIVGPESAKPGAEVLLSATVTQGKYSVAISDEPKTAGGDDFTLVIAKQGAPTPTVEVKREFPTPLLALPLLGFAFLIIPLVLFAEKSGIPRYIDPMGVTMRSGQHFPWSQYRGIRVLYNRTRSRSTYELGVILIFAGGSATVRYRPITNKPEVLWITELLKQNRNPWG